MFPFEVRRVLHGVPGETLDLVELAADGPLVIVFVHQVSRPSVGLTRVITNYASMRSGEGLTSGVVFLSDDPTGTENWTRRAAHALPKRVPVGISLDGLDGPGSFGLNRNVAMTVLVGKSGRVTANFALVQPSVQADGLKIVRAIAESLGGGDIPTLAELAGRREAGRMKKKAESRAASGPADPQLDGLLRALISKTATPEEVAATAEKVEEYAANNDRARRRIAEITGRIVAAGRLDTYGTPAAGSYLAKWARQFGERRPATNRP